MLSFHGRATVGDFIGTTSTATGVIVAGADYGSTTGWVEAPVATLVTGNAHRDRDLRASMEVDHYPVMRFTLDGATVVTSRASGSGDSLDVLLHGALTVHGVTRRVDVPATIVHGGDTTRVVAAFPLNLSEYGIGGLTKMLGLLRMEHEIDVHIDLRFINDPHSATGP
jgi:polyisoprenoid-binding protein YceI